MEDNDFLPVHSDKCGSTVASHIHPLITISTERASILVPRTTRLTRDAYNRHKLNRSPAARTRSY
jgi:hypothetical protein